MEGDAAVNNDFSAQLISIHSLRMEGDCCPQWIQSAADAISIHSLRMEGDILQRRICGGQTISIHSLRMEGDNRSRMIGSAATPFQSTPSAWRETAPSLTTQPGGKNFNPLPPHGGRPHPGGRRTPPQEFQSTPSAWRETDRVVSKKCAVKFQSTPSAWRETRRLFLCLHHLPISIHSLRMEGDPSPLHTRIMALLFQSTPSAWRETLSLGNYNTCKAFQSTPSAWRETTDVLLLSIREEFQSTPSAWRETQLQSGLQKNTDYFNPLPPHGGRRRNCEKNRIFRNISIHSLRMEGDKRNSR